MFGIIRDVFTVFNYIADFMGRCNNVVGWFDNINRFMGTGGSEGGNQVTVQHLDEIKQQIEGLAEQVNGEYYFQGLLNLFLSTYLTICHGGNYCLRRL